ncbi:hypothetical protein [Bacillus sp. EB600]|nr:hypothetical protein [Bacillus sp. EB600]MCQ6282668.1 hypothetical protein [Bacillus sp. EB600]
MKKKKGDEEMSVEMTPAKSKKQIRQERIKSSFAKAVKANGKALEKLSKN